MPALIEGITQLRDGAMQLSDGLKEFNEEGVQKLVDAVDGNLGGLGDRLQAVIDVSRNYKTFSGISDDMEGSVKFVYRTEAITAPETEEPGRLNGIAQSIDPRAASRGPGVCLFGRYTCGGSVAAPA